MGARHDGILHDVAFLRRLRFKILRWRLLWPVAERLEVETLQAALAELSKAAEVPSGP